MESLDYLAHQNFSTSENSQADEQKVTEYSNSSSSSGNNGSYSEFDNSDAVKDFCVSWSSSTSEDNHTKSSEANQKP